MIGMTRPWIARNPRITILLCSLLWALCYPPFPLGLLAFVALAPAFAATARLTRLGAFTTWFLAGLVYNTVMYWWIYNVMKVGPALVIGAGLILMIAVLSLYNGLLGLAYRVALGSPRRKLLLLLYPLAWAGIEAFRAIGDMSFPWNDYGYTLGNWPVLFQSVSLWGVYGLSALLIAANLILARVLTDDPASGSRSATLRRLAVFTAIPLLLGAHGAWVLARANDSSAPELTLSLIQPSIPQTKKWDEEYFAEVLAKTWRTMKGPGSDYAPVRGSDLIVLAETAVPDFLRTRGEVVDSLRAVVASTGASLVTGALDFVADRTPWSEYRFYNSAYFFRPGDEPPEQYSKLRLVPFSEKLPFDGVFPVLNYVNLGEGDFSPGPGHRVWRVRSADGVPWSPSICYEVIYPSFAREARATGARLLVNITNDGWFGRSNGPYQHANMARFRAAENGMPLARAANSGVSVFYDAWGRDLGHTALMDSTVLRRTIRVPDFRPFYSRAGGFLDGLFLAASVAWLLIGIGISGKGAGRRSKPG
jgi:apolipoprotein N-acyltransferase